MGMNVGSLGINSMFWGDSNVASIWWGNSLVYEDTPPVSDQCLCFTAAEAGSTISLGFGGVHVETHEKIAEYSFNRKVWFDMINDETVVTLTNIGDKVYFKGDHPSGFNNYHGHTYHFMMTGKIYASGDVTSLVDNGACVSRTLSNVGAFSNLFQNCTALLTAPDLPATSINDQCYSSMFNGCSNMVTGPSILPAGSIPFYAYAYMFQNCTALIEAPEISGYSAKGYTHHGMFYGCTSLTKAPSILVSTTAQYAMYSYMFYGCVSLEKPPEIMINNNSANNGDVFAQYMFANCSNLKYMPKLYYNGSDYREYAYMFSGCTSLIVSDTQTSDAKYQITIPFERTWSGSSQTMTDMFLNCLGTRSTDSPVMSHGSQFTYYTQNRPIPATLDECLCFTANSAGSTIRTAIVGTPMSSGFQVSTDAIHWTDFTPGVTTVTLTNAGDKVYFKGNNSGGLNRDVQNYNYFVMTGSISASGNIMSLIDNGDCTQTTIPNNYCFCRLFSGCNSLTTAPELPATTLKQYCYDTMFLNCAYLTQMPELPATTLTYGCYQEMFTGCNSAQAMTELPATTLAERCYKSMFHYCYAMTTAPIMPDTIITAPNYCCQSMFAYCRNLRTVPTLSATIIQAYAYMYMFLDCESITTPPELPATSLQYQCYCNMFSQCYSLTTVPKLPATSLEDSCYQGMFSECNHLYVSDTSGTGYDKAWTIPSSSAGSGNYTMSNMFRYCLGTRSTDSPNFNGTQITYYTQNNPIPYVPEYYGLTFTANTAGSTVSITKTGSPSLGQNFQYSTDKINWYTFTPGSTTVTLANVGDYVCFKGNNPNGLNQSSSIYYTFSMTGSIAASGDIMSLLDNGTCSLRTIPNTHCFNSLFFGNTAITSTPQLTATELTAYCYFRMFYNCTSLTSASILPATTLQSHSYSSMFYGCTSLQVAPTIEATTVATYSCSSMFEGCSTLYTYPNLKATNLDMTCYMSMFKNCGGAISTSYNSYSTKIPWRIPTTGNQTSSSMVPLYYFYTGTPGTKTLQDTPRVPANSYLTLYVANNPV